MKQFYYQIKGRSGNIDEVSTYYGGYSKWVFPPIFSGKVTANNTKEAKKLIEDLYEKQFPLRVLSKDLSNNEFLLNIEEIKPGSHIERLFEKRECKQCGNGFYIIDKYNDTNNREKGFDFCCYECREEYYYVKYNKKAEEIENAGVHKPVIYKITNKNTKKVYVGKTTQAFTLRWYQHFFQGGNCKFHETIKNSKIEDWIFEVIETISIPENVKTKSELEKLIVDRERYWINQYNAIENGYNTL